MREGQPTLFRDVRRDTVFIFGSGKLPPVTHCDPTACPHGLNTDHVIRVDVGIVWHSFDEYKFGHGLHRIRGNISVHTPMQHRRSVPSKVSLTDGMRRPVSDGML